MITRSPNSSRLWSLTSSASAAPKGLVEIRPQVVHVLAADRDPHELVGQPGGLALVLRHAGVRHRRGMLDERLDPPERHGQREQLHAVHHRLPGRQPAP
jgi:hypothetical protein